jgi:hypothetical protein
MITALRKGLKKLNFEEGGPTQDSPMGALP